MGLPELEGDHFHHTYGQYPEASERHIWTDFWTFDFCKLSIKHKQDIRVGYWTKLSDW
jgi:hypothetical protein